MLLVLVWTWRSRWLLIKSFVGRCHTTKLPLCIHRVLINLIRIRLSIFIKGKSFLWVNEPISVIFRVVINHFWAAFTLWIKHIWHQLLMHLCKRFDVEHFFLLKLCLLQRNLSFNFFHVHKWIHYKVFLMLLKLTI